MDISNTEKAEAGVNGNAGSIVKEDGVSVSVPEGLSAPISQEKLEEAERKSRVDAAWEQMNKGMSMKVPKILTNKSKSASNKTAQKTSHHWMSALGIGPRKTEPLGQGLPQKRPHFSQNETSDEAKRLAAAALLAVKDAAAAAAAAATGRGKIEITEVRDFAGENVEVKKLVDADSKEAAEKVKGAVGSPSAVDAILEQIKKKQKLSVLDKTKKDWGEFKEEKKLDEELDAYKKSSNQYLDKVSFLQRTDMREFERERDARLALQAKRRPDTREGP
ncbi:hypothetical protein AQUCO_01300429v1 [Aquilegia coerulea]|uniref:BCNT-C domain-containing protein n=1 Tax=Aquilegia coerulea TaxID=218851 RepID=A0A2G5E1K8_AQUCA|nr:hypothetical protein AQUCO_01300429v1 [Aquilegia coerulea]